MKAAFLGLGTMGAPMARNLIDAGHDLAVYDVAQAARTPFEGRRCRVASSPADAADQADIVLCMLPDSSHVRESLLGVNGVCGALSPGRLVVDMSTIGASASAELARDLGRRGFRMLDAPVGRTPRDAAAGTLLIIVGGAVEDLAEAQPLFRCLADTIVHAGPQGHGIKLKLVNNYMAMVGTLLAAEALTLANKAGLDRDTTVRVLSSTTAGRGPLLVTYPDKVLAGDVSADFPLRMAHKDVSHALSLGSEVGSPLLLGAIAREVFALATPWGRADEDWTATLLLVEDLCKAPHLPSTRFTKEASDGNSR